MGAAYDLTGVWGLGKLRYRGDGLVEAWVAGVGAWTGVGGILFVSSALSVGESEYEEE
jgi:hypothetical protein